MIQQSNKRFKRGHAFIDTAKEINVWVYRHISGGTYNVCDDPLFLGSANFYNAELSDLKELHQKHSSSIISKPKPITDKQKIDKELMNEFFSVVALKIPYNCQECGKPLYAFNKVAKRAVCAHILPKSKFESIKTDPENIFYLGADYIGCPCNCHDRWDASVEIRITMNVYNFALKQFYKMKHKLTPEEIKRAYTYLNIEWQ